MHVHYEQLNADFCFFVNINGRHELRNSDHDPIMTVMEILKW